MKIGMRFWILIIVVLLALLSIVNFQGFQSGVLVKSVETNSSVYQEGLRAGAVIKAINGQTISNLGDYSAVISNVSSGEEQKLSIQTADKTIIVFTNTTPQIEVSALQKTKIKTGLDLQGGARALVQPEAQLSASEMADLISVTSNRLNVYGISDISVRGVSDLSGNRFMLIEVAGATPSDLQELISKQGKFEAKIGNETVFVGGNKDITSVCRNDATCAVIESCTPSQGSYICNFRFSISLSPTSAQRQADITSQLTINYSSSGGSYLDKPLDLYVDNNLVDSLLISEGLQGQVTTQISIQGSGKGVDQQAAYKDAQDSMKKLQTILITGSLPYKLSIVKLDKISPLLGQQFINYILLAGVGAILAVALIVFVKYRNLKISLAIIGMIVSEIVIILGLASLIRWNLDLPSIAGILTTIGTGVDQQIIMVDEANSKKETGLTQKLKRALFIIVGAYFTALASLLPLYWAGAGLLKGFAVTTIMGITVGVLITRPAFANLMEILSKHY